MSLDCFAAHDSGVIAVGSQRQMINIWTESGELVMQTKFHKGFMGHRIGAVASLAFHPTKHLLCTGAHNSFVSILAANPEK